MIDQFRLELAFEREISRSRCLSSFRRNATTWEFMLLLAANERKDDVGLYKTLDMLDTNYLGQSALLKFVRDKRDDSLINFDEHEKRSMVRLNLAPAVLDELTAVLVNRNQHLGAAFSEVPGPNNVGNYNLN